MERKVITGLATLNLRKNSLKQAQNMVKKYTDYLKRNQFNGKPLDDEGRDTIGSFIKLYNNLIKRLEALIKQEEPKVQKQLKNLK